MTTTGGWIAVESFDGKSLYYLNGPDRTSSSLWRAPLPDGEHEEIARNIVWWSFWVNEHGIYYMDGDGKRSRLRFFDFATRTHATVAENLGEAECCVTSSGDGRTILYPRRDSEVHDLMLVEDVR